MNSLASLSHKWATLKTYRRCRNLWNEYKRVYVSFFLFWRFLPEGAGDVCVASANAPL
jgi:hypothetical protein